MQCSADNTQMCGGPGALSLFVELASLDPRLSADYASLTATLPSGWSVASTACIAEGTTGRALSGASTTSNSMTISMCLNYCQGKGFQYAGIEYSGECYCDNALENGALLSITSKNCDMPCSGMPGTICGGPGALSLYQNPSLAAATTTSTTAIATPTIALPSGWSVASSVCIAEGTNGRALSGASTASSSMTIPMCLQFCQSKGYQWAGIEYSGECYCDNDFKNGASLSLTSSRCEMPCLGDSTTMCGGPDALSLFNNPSVTAPTTASSTTAITSTTSAAPAPTTVALPDGWSVASTVCLAEGTSGRALAGASTTSNSMTYAMCLGFCRDKGFQYAGIEYSGECYCGNEIANGASLSISSSNCDMPCSGDSSSMCGGPSAIQLFNNPSFAVSVATTINGYESRMYPRSQRSCSDRGFDRNGRYDAREMYFLLRGCRVLDGGYRVFVGVLLWTRAVEWGESELDEWAM